MSASDLINQAKKDEKNGDFDAAINNYKKAFELEPKNFFIQIELGNLYALSNQYEEAAGYFRRAIRRFPDNKAIKEGLGFCLCETGNFFHSQRNFHLAQAAFEEATYFCDDNPSYFFNLGNALYYQDNFKGALKAFIKSLSLKNDSETLHNLGNTNKKLKKYDDAQRNYKNALRMNSKQIHTLVELIQLKQITCNWDDMSKLITDLKDYINHSGDGKISPFASLSMPGLSINEHLKIASTWIESHKLQLNNQETLTNKGSKIVIGYISADFRLHPLFYLIFDILKLHDYKIFDIKLFYSGKDDGSSELIEFQKLNADFININEYSDADLRKKLSHENVDILVDLSGFTSQSRSLIFTQNPAKISINWLGFPGSMGSLKTRPLHDIILADNYIIPKDQEQYYAEKIVRLSGCYQPNIAHRPPLKKVSREKNGIESNAFVFASFGQSVKITEVIYKLWLKLLLQKSNSVLWLLESNQKAQENLHIIADEFGVESKRVIFAKKVSFADHIGRHSIIDLFLDTFPYNAHTSTSDAIWAECPVITLSGKTFASRVAGSILTELGCDELITENENDYFNKALFLSNNPDALKRIKEKIIKGKSESNLFKPEKFVLELEGIYKTLLSS